MKQPTHLGEIGFLGGLLIWAAPILIGLFVYLVTGGPH